MKRQDPIIYLSGFGSFTNIEERIKWVKDSGCNHRCYSFAFVSPKGFYHRPDVMQEHDYMLESGRHVMMDSSGYSFHRFTQGSGGQISKGKHRNPKQVEEFREEIFNAYVEMCKKYKKKWDFYVTFDYLRHCPTIYKTTQALIQHGLWPVPIYHGDQTLDWFKRYIDEGHTLIGIASERKRAHYWTHMRFFLDSVFNEAEKQRTKIRLHGFAMMGPQIMLKYPWYSVDSATWAYMTSYGCIYLYDQSRGTCCNLHVSPKVARTSVASYNTMSKEARAAVVRIIEDEGFDFKEVSTDAKVRSVYNAKMVLRLPSLLREGMTSGLEKIRWGSIL